MSPTINDRTEHKEAIAMLMVDLIRKKRDGNALSKEEIDFFIKGYTSGEIPDYQASALMMAVFFRGMTDRETVDLTMSMMNSGDVLDLSGIKGIKADKHSTGGVGDKTSLVVTPLVAAYGIPVAKMSGRGLGHTGGTVDKLESFKGFSTAISPGQFKDNVEKVGMSIMGQTAELAPADKLLYALRDVTATVDNMSLIASSIMSKKLAAGADVIVLDVKCGDGAFMKSFEDARALADKMVTIGNMAGRKTAAVFSDMDEPLGFAVGNALEVREAIETLKGNGPERFTSLCLTLAAKIVTLVKDDTDEDTAKNELKEIMDDKRGLRKFAEFIEAQGGDPDDVYHPENLPSASMIYELRSENEGYISRIHCEEVGLCSLILGGGRRTKEDTIDLSVGIILDKKVGDRVEKGDILAHIHANDEKRLNEAKSRLLAAYEFSGQRPKERKIIQDIIG